MWAKRSIRKTKQEKSFGTKKVSIGGAKTAGQPFMEAITVLV